MRHDELRESLARDVVQAARDLLGWELAYGAMRARIVETEAYRTPDDAACHAHRGKTARNAVMFEGPGLAYIYFSYGSHWMLNVTALEAGNGAAVLVRAARPIAGVEEMRRRRPMGDLLNGPGKLCQALGIDRSFNGKDLLDEVGPHLEPGQSPTRIAVGPRVGIRVAQEHRWRFADADALEWVSSPIGTLAVP